MLSSRRKGSYQLAIAKGIRLGSAARLIPHPIEAHPEWSNPPQDGYLVLHVVAGQDQHMKRRKSPRPPRSIWLVSARTTRPPAAKAFPDWGPPAGPGSNRSTGIRFLACPYPPVGATGQCRQATAAHSRGRHRPVGGDLVRDLGESAAPVPSAAAFVGGSLAVVSVGDGEPSSRPAQPPTSGRGRRAQNCLDFDQTSAASALRPRRVRFDRRRVRPRPPRARPVAFPGSLKRCRT